MKDTPTEIKNNSQGNNSRVDEAENKTDYLEQKEEKNIKSEKQKEKKSPKTQGLAKEPLGQLQEVQHSHHRGARRRERARNWKSI